MTDSLEDKLRKAYSEGVKKREERNRKRREQYKEKKQQESLDYSSFVYPSKQSNSFRRVKPINELLYDQNLKFSATWNQLVDDFRSFPNPLKSLYKSFNHRFNNTQKLMLLGFLSFVAWGANGIMPYDKKLDSQINNIVNYFGNEKKYSVIDKDLSLPPGNYTFDYDVTVKKGAILRLYPGTTISFSKHSELKVLGRIIAEGTEENPINFVPINDSWNGMVLIGNSNNSSSLEHIIVTSAKKDQGGGIYIENCNPEINYAVISGCEAKKGAGIYVKKGNVTISNSIIKLNNTPEEAISGDNNHSGGGLFLETAQALITDSQIINNTGYLGGGVYLINSDIKLNNTIIKNNSAKKSMNEGAFAGGNHGLGGGIYADNSTVTLNKSFIRENISMDDGGGVYLNSSRLTLINSIIINNSANGLTWNNDTNQFDREVSEYYLRDALETKAKNGFAIVDLYSENGVITND